MRPGLKTTFAIATRLLLVIAAVCGCAIAAHGAAESKRILLLFTSEAHQPGQDMIEDAIRSTLQSGSPSPLEIYSEYLDAQRTPLSDFEKDQIGRASCRERV